MQDDLLTDTSSRILADDLVLDLEFQIMDSHLAATSFLIQTPREDRFLASETLKISHRAATSLDAAVGIATMKM